MPRGWSYVQYHQAHAGEKLCDARILDAFGEAIVAGGKVSTKPLKKFFGGFVGQVFFLGTSFLSIAGRACVPFLNIGLPLPAIRYMCPEIRPVNRDVLCCACFFRS
jgi:hypothetical protein